MQTCGESLHCKNCSEIFQRLRPGIAEVVVSRHFEHDYPGFDPALITGCQSVQFKHLHKFERNVDGNHVFRALIRHTHLVYAVDRQNRLILMRAFSNFNDYNRFLDDDKLILKTIEDAGR